MDTRRIEALNSSTTRVDAETVNQRASTADIGRCVCQISGPAVQDIAVYRHLRRHDGVETHWCLTPVSSWVKRHAIYSLQHGLRTPTAVHIVPSVGQ